MNHSNFRAGTPYRFEQLPWPRPMAASQGRGWWALRSRGCGAKYSAFHSESSLESLEWPV